MINITLKEFMELLLIVLMSVAGAFWFIRNRLKLKRWKIHQDRFFTCKNCNSRFLACSYDLEVICPNCASCCQLKWQEGHGKG